MDIRQEVISLIKKQFPKAVIYGEDKKQGFQEPCFFVYEVDVERKKEVGRRYQENVPLVIQYFSDQKHIKDDCAKVRQILFELLEVLPANKVRAVKLNAQVIDDVLTVKVSYKHYLMREKVTVPKMQQLERKGQLYGDS